jgi:hypothetical protein
MIGAKTQSGERDDPRSPDVSPSPVSVPGGVVAARRLADQKCRSAMPTLDPTVLYT